jgi:MEMO1 family protein
VAAAAAGIETWFIPAERLDHGSVVPLWFVAEAGWSGPVVLVAPRDSALGGLEQFGAAIGAAAGRLKRRIAVLASGDMSHRLQPGAPGGFDPRAREFDKKFIELLCAGSYRDLAGMDARLQEPAGEDVMDATVVALAAANWDGTGREVLSYEAPFGVGYGVAVLSAP